MGGASTILIFHDHMFLRGGNIIDWLFVDYRRGANVDSFFHLNGEYRQHFCWEPFPMVKIFFCLGRTFVPNLNPPSLTRPPVGLRGQPETLKCHFSIFFTKSGSEPDLGVLGGWAGCQKIGDNPPPLPP